MEVVHDRLTESELGVVSLNDDLGGPLDGLCSNATHLDVVVVVEDVRFVVDR